MPYICSRNNQCSVMTEKYIIDQQELKLYEDSVNAYRDIVNAIRTAEKKKFAEGRAEGRAEGEKETKERIAANLLSLGVPIETIVQASGLSEEEITNIQ